MLYKYEKDIRIIQVRQKISRQQANITFNIQNTNFIVNLAEIAQKSTSNDVDMSVSGVATGGMRQREQDIYNGQRTS